MTDNEKREDLIRAVQAVTWNASNYPEKAQPHILGQNVVPLTMKIVDAVEAVFEKAHAKELDTSAEPVKNGADSLHVELSDDQRHGKSMDITVHEVLGDWPQTHKVVDALIEDGHFRRPVSPEPQIALEQPKYVCSAHPFGCPEPQGDPSFMDAVSELPVPVEGGTE